MENKDNLHSIILDRPIANPILPKGKKIILPEADDALEFSASEIPEISAIRGQAFHIAYVNAKGERSERVIRLFNVLRGSHGFLLGSFCYARNAFRTFRADRIEEMYWMDTGEIVEDTGAMFKAMCDKEDVPILLELYWPGLMVLAYVARCDGYFHPAEAEVMADYIEWQCTESLSGKEQVKRRQEILDNVRSIYPEEGDVKKALWKMYRSPKDQKRDVKRHIRMLCDADGILRDEEADWVVSISDMLGR